MNRSRFCTLLRAATLIAALACSSFASSPIQSTIHVSPDGKGTGQSADSPCSLLAARDMVRKMNGKMTGAIVVQLAGGIYSMTEPLELIESDTIHDSGGNGFDVIREIKAQFPEINAVAVSGYGTDEDLRKSAEAGFKHHLVKPIGIDTLRRALAS